MSSKRWSGTRSETRVLDIWEAIRALRSYVAGYSRESLLRDKKTQSAVERQLEIISEACIKLRHIESASELREDQYLEQRYPDVAWAPLRVFGNRLRHEYGRVDPAVVWAIAVEAPDLDALKNALADAYPGFAICR